MKRRGTSFNNQRAYDKYRLECGTDDEDDECAGTGQKTIS